MELTQINVQASRDPFRQTEPDWTMQVCFK